MINKKEGKKQKKFTIEVVIKMNELLGKRYKTDFGILNNGNLEMALSKEKSVDIAREIIQLHPFVDANKRTAFLILQARCYHEIDENLIDIIMCQHDDWLQLLSEI